MSKPTSKPDWALLDQVDPISGQNNVVEPTAGHKNYGWSRAEEPARNYDNWRGRLTAQWIDYLESSVRGATLKVAANNAMANSKELADYTCDGVDDQVQINAAITAAATTGGTVVLSEGTFYITNSVELANNVALVGMGRGATIITMPSAPTSNIELVQIEGSATCAVYSLAIVGLLSGTHGQRGIATAGGDTRLFLRDLIVKNMRKVDAANYGEGLLIEGTNTLADNVHTEGCERVGIELCPSSTFAEIVGCHSSGDQVGLRIAGSFNHVSGCTVQLAQANGIEIVGDDCVLEGCTIYKCSQAADATYSGLYCSAGSNCVIKGNTVRHGGGAAQHAHAIDVDLVSPPTGYAVFSNDFRNSAKTSVFFEGPTPPLPAGTFVTCPEWIVYSDTPTFAQNDIGVANLGSDAGP